MSFIPEIRLFSCHYTSQQGCAQEGRELKDLGFPENVQVTRLSCTGKLKMITLLKAFEDGADGVYVVGCPVESCHNAKGSQRAAKRVQKVKEALKELNVEPDRIQMYHLNRGLHPEFLDIAAEMTKLITDLGPTPFAG